MYSQGLLFSDPCMAETAVWCELRPGIDPRAWASVCRLIGRLEPAGFDAVAAALRSQTRCLSREGKSTVDNRNSSAASAPLLSVGPSGLGGEYQAEMSAG